MIKILFIESSMFLKAITLKKFTNLIKEIWNLRHCKPVVSNFPHRYYIEPTNTCTLLCPFCLGNRRSSRSKGFMSFDLFKQLIDDISPYAIVINLYLNGESFLHKNIIEMINYAKKKKISIKIDTNMHIMNEAMAKKLIISRLDRLILDIDGANQEIYSKYRVGGNLNKVLHNLSLLRRVRDKMNANLPIIEVRTIVMGYNEHQLNQIKEISYKNGADNVFFVPMTMNAVDDEIYKKWAPSNPYKSLYDPLTRRNKFGSNAKNRCSELWTMGFIQWDGTIIACCMNDEGKGLGKINRALNFTDIWHGKNFVAARKSVCGLPTDTVNDCTNCKGKMKYL